MCCYNPMLAEPLPILNPETKKRQYKFLCSVRKWLTHHPDDEDILRSCGYIDVPITHDQFAAQSVDQVCRRNFVPMPEDHFCYVPDRSTGEVKSRYVARKLIVLPCGQCLDCRCKKAQEWANRIMLEAQYHDKSYFITLTYDDEHVPLVRSPFGEVCMSLRKADLQAFIKRLRRQQEYHKGNKIRYYAVGEYGSQYHRPHYHLVIFGLDLDDIVEVGRNKHGTMLHDSPTIRNLWSNGITEVDEMNWESAAYCARYTVKKLGKAESSFYEDHGLLPEFSVMSLKPAIGYPYFEDHARDIYEFDKIHISTAKGGKEVKPPRYFDSKYDDIYPAQMAEVKCNRRALVEDATAARLHDFGGSYLELLYMQEEAMKNRNKLLRRNLE